MNELTLEQTDRIIQFVKRQEIVFSHLSDDLIDHICCDLEELIMRGVGFDDAFREVRRRIGKSGLKTIQEDTLYAVDSKYRKMKKTMKISGVAGTILLGLASVFKIMHWPFAGIMISLGALILITLFLPSSLTVLWKESKSGKRLFLFITAFFASALFIAGVLFKVQHWPGSSLVIAIGMFTAIILFVPALIYRLVNDPDNTLPRWLFLTGGTAVALYGAGFLFKVMHWPAAALLLTISTLLLAILILPAYIYYRWGKDEHITLGAVAIIASFVLFLGPTLVISFRKVPNFDSMFLTTYSLNNKSVEYRLARNEKIIKEFSGSHEEPVVILHSGTVNLIEFIDKAEETLLNSDMGLIHLINNPVTDQNDLLFDSHSELMMLFSDMMITGELERMLQDYRLLVTSMAGPGVSAYTNEFPTLEGYLPLGENVIDISPVVIMQSLDMLKAAILDIEAATIREISRTTTINE